MVVILAHPYTCGFVKVAAKIQVCAFANSSANLFQTGSLRDFARFARVQTPNLPLYANPLQKWCMPETHMVQTFANRLPIT